MLCWNFVLLSSLNVKHRPPLYISLSCFHYTGLLTAVHKDYFRVINYQEVHFNDCGDRVAQLLHVELASPVSQFRNNDIRQEMLIVNTHLLFPHDSSLCTVRLRQVP